jgi:two-component system phosphate regulon sensor histidine kinase PhoR
MNCLRRALDCGPLADDAPGQGVAIPMTDQPATRRRPIPTILLAFAPLAVALLLLWGNGWMDARAALTVVAAAAAGLWLGHWRIDRQVRTFVRYAEGLSGEKSSSPTSEAPPADHPLTVALDRLGRHVATERAAVAGRASAADGMIDSLPDPVILVDGTRRIVRANAAAGELLGRTLVGDDMALSLRHPAILTAVSDVLEGRGSSRALEVSFPAPVSRDFTARIVAVPTRGDMLAVLILHDLTALRRAEQMRVDFVANASHELRTPLTTLIGFIETLQGPAKDDAAAQERFLAIMSAQAARMARLIRDLLSLSQIEMNEHTPPRDLVNLRDVLGTVIDTLHIEAQNASVALRLDAPEDLPRAIGDADELTQVFQNLVDNAIKYGRRDTEVTVAARVSGGNERGSPALSVSVTDRGEGIAREHLPRLTERFYRVDSARSRALGGTGLGLAIVKHIVNRHRGSLTIHSVVGQGTTFTVFLSAEGSR